MEAVEPCEPLGKGVALPPAGLEEPGRLAVLPLEPFELELELDGREGMPGRDDELDAVGMLGMDELDDEVEGEGMDGLLDGDDGELLGMLGMLDELEDEELVVSQPASVRLSALTVARAARESLFILTSSFR